MVDRPSYRELDRKLKLATEAATAKRIRLLDPDVILADLLDLDYMVGDLPKTCRLSSRRSSRRTTLA